MSNAHGSKWIRAAKRCAIYARDGFACIYCGDSVEEGAKLSLDHVLPRELGGTHHESNLATCCLSCNSAKQDCTEPRVVRHAARPRHRHEQAGGQGAPPDREEVGHRGGEEAPGRAEGNLRR